MHGKISVLVMDTATSAGPFITDASVAGLWYWSSANFSGDFGESVMQFNPNTPFHSPNQKW